MWKHLIYKDLILCLVSVNEEVTMSIIKNIPTLPKNLLYHSLDLISHGTINEDVLCIHQNNIIALCKKNTIFIHLLTLYIIYI